MENSFLTTYSGEIAALSTAILFGFTSMMFTLAGRELNSSALVNRTRLLVAVILMALFHWLTFGSLLPVGADASHWFWLALSGLIGLALGDAFLFQAFVMIGPRLSMLMMALAPVIATILAWIFLGEFLNSQQLIGIAITVLGVFWVISERGTPSTREISPRGYLFGILFGLGGAVGQAGGMVTAKLGLTDNFPAFSGNMIRMLAAAVVIWGFTIVRGQVGQGFVRLRQHPRALVIISAASLIGPVIAVWLSLLAVQHAPVGIVSTLIGLTPIFLIPITYVIFHEKPTVRAVLGTVVAFAGTALLFL
ncbi:MAG: DMT family transporter [Anaerolineaceae bacterium]|nr:DMT family transporter [Anaerolineaceae bacterium]